MGLQGAGLGRRPQAFRYCLYRHIENRRQQQSEKSHTQHAAEHGSAQQLAGFRTRAFSDHQRKYAHNEGERGHQNGTQTDSGGFHGGFEAVKAALLPLLREFHDQNGVLAGKSHQDDKADLGEDIVVHVA